MLEGHRNEREDAKISRDRALQAMVEAEDFPTKRSLWRLALCMNGKMKVAGSACDYAPRRLQASAQGDGTCRT